MRRWARVARLRIQRAPALLAPALVAVALIGSGCSELGAGTGQISQRIGQVVQDPSARTVDLGRLTSFGWDRFYFFKPGTRREEICAFIQANRNICGRIIRYTEVPADHMALLFGLGGQLTHTELHALAHGQFDVPLDESGIARERSVFRIHRVSMGTGKDTVLLEAP